MSLLQAFLKLQLIKHPCIQLLLNAQPQTSFYAPQWICNSWFLSDFFSLNFLFFYLSKTPQLYFFIAAEFYLTPPALNFTFFALVKTIPLKYNILVVLHPLYFPAWTIFPHHLAVISLIIIRTLLHPKPPKSKILISLPPLILSIRPQLNAVF